ncbi:MAG: lipid A export permease/ATP-binding protein MsbA [Pseudomonadota bacterium]
MHSDWQLYKRLLTYMTPFLSFLGISVVGNIAYALSQVLAADAMQLVVDSFGAESQLMGQEKVNGILSGIIHNVIEPQLGEQFSVMFWVPFSIVFVSLLRALSAFLGKHYIERVGFNSIHEIRKDVFEHLLNSPVSFFDNNNNAHLISRITFNVQQVSEAVTNALMISIREGFTVLGMLGYMLYLNWRLTLVFLLVVPFIAVTISYVSKRFRRLSSRIQDSMGDVTHVTSETVSSVRAVKVFSGEAYEHARFIQASEYNRDQNIRMSFTNSLSSPFMQLLVSIALAVLIAYGLNPVVTSSISPGSFVAFLTAAGLIAKPLRQLGDVVNIVQRGLAAAEDIFSQLDTDIEKNTGTRTLTQVNGDLKISGLSFSYDMNSTSSDTILDNINVHVKPGEVLALVGRSGSGKSTLVNLLPRFSDYTNGEILLDDTDINTLELNNLRAQFSLVSQHVNLFNDTLYNNIAYGSLRDSDPEAVREAMRIAYVDEFVADLENGEHTIVGDHGVLLSGGQRQRIAIARALLKNAPVLILDEATSALDNDSEQLIQSALEQVMVGKTTIVIAHRLSTVENADQILLLDQGKIIERGTHSELLALEGGYHSLYHSQFKAD